MTWNPIEILSKPKLQLTGFDEAILTLEFMALLIASALVWFVISELLRRR